MKRRFILVIGFIAALALFTYRGEAALKESDRIAICGDSITEQKLYTLYMEQYLLMCKPAPGMTVCQFGWSGERAPGFASRMGNDVLWFKPTVATTAYGMNDGSYKPYVEETGRAYRDATRAIVKKFKDAGVRLIVVGSPGATDPAYMKVGQAPAKYNKVLAQLRDIARQVAEEEGVVFANVHDAMLQAMEKAKARWGEKHVFTGGDGFHPGPNGQLAMAYAFLKAMGCDGNIGQIAIDLGSNAVGATDGHKVLSVSAGSVEIESARYPFCFSGDVNQATTRNAAEVLPFNQELNRFRLIVKGAGSGKVKVTWGDASKEFAAGDLEQGINLAAEFIDQNPFIEQFAKVDRLIRDKQNFETPLHKDLLNRLPNFRRMLPEESEAFDRLVAAGAKKQAALAAAAAAAVTPVRHTIKVEAVK